MKIIYITNARIPTKKAHGYQICKMCEEFAESGHEVELWVPRRNNPITNDLFSYYGLKKNFKTRKIWNWPFLRNEGQLKGKFIWLFNLIFYLSALILKINKNSLIYTREVEIAWLARRRGLKTVTEIHNYPNNRQRIFNFLLQGAGKIVVISDGLRKMLISAGVDGGNILVAPDGVDFEQFDINIRKKNAREKLNLPQDKKIVVYSGHLYKWKGVKVLAEAAKKLGPGTVVYFVGGTESDQKKFKKEFIELVVAGKIILIGHQPYKMIPIWLKAADILVLPNSGKEKISSEYTSPLKLFEYMASGRPIVASALPSIKEILNEENSVLIKADDQNELARGIIKVIEDPNSGSRLPEKAKEDAKKYTWQKRAGKIINFITNE